MLPLARLEQNQEMEMALTSDVEPEPLQFPLDADCLDELFDYLSLRDLCAMGRTCKRLYRAAGKYFKQNYPFEALQLEYRRNGKIVHTVCIDYKTNFNAYARRLMIDGDDINKYRFASTQKYPNLKMIIFQTVEDFSDDLFACIVKMNILAQVVAIKIVCCSHKFCFSILKNIFEQKLCANLKNLILINTLHHDDKDEMDLCPEWRYQQCPMLERLEIEDFFGYFYKNHLENFLRANPQIKNLAVRDDDSFLAMIRAITIKLDELEYADYSVRNELCDQMIALNENGYIKNLKLSISCWDKPMDNLKDISCLVSVKIDCLDFELCPHHNATIIATLVNLKKLHFRRFTKLSLSDAERLSQTLSNLEELDFGYSNPLSTAIPFARRLPKLKIIKCRFGLSATSHSSNIDLNALNNDRLQLPDAEILKIYLDDYAYVQVRWKSIDLFYDLVEVRRFRHKDGRYF